ncbi:MAG: YdeI/OmpD-associated family protein, partial [Thermoanaerobaculia bacterium]
FFATPSAFRRWLTTNHDRIQELWVGFQKRHTGRPSLTWPEAVDQALCFGWIDGLRKSIDDESYMIRFTPRKARSIWSAVNLRRFDALRKEGLVEPAGLHAHQRRDENRTNRYSFENRDRKLDPEYEKKFRANRAAWEFFTAQPPWYQRTASWWVVSAKKEETQLRRLQSLIDCSEQGKTIGPLTRKKK